MDIQAHPSPDTKSDTPRGRVVILRRLATLAALIACFLAAYAVFRGDPRGDHGGGLPARFQHDVESYLAIDPALIGYRETTAFALELRDIRAVAVGLDDRVYVAGDRMIQVCGLDGTMAESWPLDGEPHCLGVGSLEHVQPGRVYVGMRDRVVVCGEDGTSIATWTAGFDERSGLTSIAVAEADVFVADAGNRVILRFDVDGQLTTRIGQSDPSRGIPGFVLPSGHFDVAVSPDGLLRAANPGARLIETYTFAGDRLGAWGESSASIYGFFGCCNPINFAVLADGSFVTVEKGLTRVKVYDRNGKLNCVVAGAQTLAPGEAISDEVREEHQASVLDVAADPLGRIVLTDPRNGRIRVFEPEE